MTNSASDPLPYEVFTQPRPLLVVLSGPSGVGKDSTMAGLREKGAEFYQVVTATTRPQRPNEVDGVDYHFLSMQEFAEMIEAQELLEHAVVYGDYKGIPKAEVRKGMASGPQFPLSRVTTFTSPSSVLCTGHLLAISSRRCNCFSSN